MTPQGSSLRGWAAIVALVAMIPLVAYAASAADHDEPPREEPSWRPAPSLSLRLEPEALRLSPGEHARAAYVVRNEGDRPEEALIETTAHGAGVTLTHAQAKRVHLAPGEEARGVVRLRAADEWVPISFVHLQASAGSEPRITTIALLRVEMPAPVVEVAPLPEIRPLPPMAEPVCPVLRCHIPCAPHADAHAHPHPHAYDRPFAYDHPHAHDHAHPHAVEADGSFLLHILLRGRVVDDQLVIDLDDDLRARLPRLVPLTLPPMPEPPALVLEPMAWPEFQVEFRHEPEPREPEPAPEPEPTPTWEEGRS